MDKLLGIAINNMAGILSICKYIFGIKWLNPLLIPVLILISIFILHPFVAIDNPYFEKIKNLHLSMQEVEKSEITIRDIFFERLTHYKNLVDKFNNYLAIFFATSIISLIVIWRNADNLQWIGINVPTKWLYFILPCVMLYYWLSFGYVFDDAISTRIRCVVVASAISTPSSDFLKTMFHDSGIIDGWFIAFIDEINQNNRVGSVSGIRHSSPILNTIFMTLVFSSILGVFHSCMFVLVVIGMRKYLFMDRMQIWQNVISLFVFLSILISSHIFFYVGNNYNIVQPTAFLIFLIISGLLLRSTEGKEFIS